MYSAVMATRPDEPFIGDALTSIHAQTLPADRIVVVVNGPGAVDGAFRRALERDFPGVEVRAIPQPSMSAAFAHVLPDIRSPFIAFLDADDLWVPEKQALQVARLLHDPGLDAVSCVVANFRDQSDGTVAEGRVAMGKLFGAMTFRTDVFTRFGLPDAQASHFTWLYRWWAAASAAGIVTDSLDQVGLRRRVHDGNGWVTDRVEGRQQLLAELRRINRERRRVSEAAEANA